MNKFTKVLASTAMVGAIVTTALIPVTTVEALSLPTGPVSNSQQQVKDVSEVYINLAEGFKILAAGYKDVVTVVKTNAPGDAYSYMLNINLPKLKANYTVSKLKEKGIDDISYLLAIALENYDEFKALAKGDLLTVEVIMEVDRKKKEYVTSTFTIGKDKVVEGEELRAAYKTFKRNSSVSTFTDVTNHWAKEHIYDLVELGIVQGKTPTTFEPQSTLTRAQFASMLARSMPNAKTILTSNPFVDVSSEHWAAKDIQLLNELGVVNGTTATTFNPNSKITRQQATTMIMRYLDVIGVDTSDVKTTVKFTDSNKVYDYAKEGVGKLSNLGVISGLADGSFNPSGDLTRSQMSKILDLTLDLVID